MPLRLRDLRDFDETASIEADLCIVGTGPAGVTIAREFAGFPIRVLMIEGGGIEQRPEHQALFDFENVGAARYLPQSFPRQRMLGGTSDTWSGRCVPFDEIDYEQRAWVPNSGWPLGANDMVPFLERASEFLGIGPVVYDDRVWKRLGIAPPQPSFNPLLLKPQFWQFSWRRNGDPTRFSDTIASLDASNVEVLTHANVTHVGTSPCGTQLRSVEVRTLGGKRFEISPKILVLACGGVENARLLLASNRIMRDGVGNANDLVGRFLMDHPGSTLGWFPSNANAIQDRLGMYFVKGDKGLHRYLYGLALNPEVQRREGLLNCAAYLNEVPSADDPWYAAKSLIAAARGKSFLARQASQTLTSDVKAVVRHLPKLISNIHRRLAKHRSAIVVAKELILHCLVEQVPDPDSRVTLSEKADALGMPLARIDWRISELERRSVLRLSELLRQELRRLGLPDLSPNVGIDDDDNWRSSFIDSAHPMGATRMAASPRQGVVDSNCRVHDVAGLYVAGSSVFATAGHANPTLMIVALAIRLADWLKRNEFKDQLKR